MNTRLADAYINLAAVQTVRHQPATALQVFEALLAFAPGHPRALAARALTLKDMDRLDEALETAKRAALVAPESPEPHNALGQVHEAMGAFEPALEAYRRAAALPGPAQMDAIANLGDLYMEFGHKAEALKAMEEAAKTFPDAPGILFRSDRTAALRGERPADRADAGAARSRGDLGRRSHDAALRPRQGFARHRPL